MSTKIESVSIGPVRIPKSYKEGLDILMEPPHITRSHLVREAIYLFLKEKGVIKDERIIFRAPYISGRTEDVRPIKDD
jgi:hypothetical protein